MRPELEQYQQIDLYLQDKLSVEDKHAFETAMQNNPDLLEAVEMQKMVNTVILNAGYQDLKAEMSSDIEAIDKKSNANKWKKGSAIGVAGLLLVSGALWMNNTEETNVLEKTVSTEVLMDSNSVLLSEEKETPTAEVVAKEEKIEEEKLVQKKVAEKPIEKQVQKPSVEEVVVETKVVQEEKAQPEIVTKEETKTVSKEIPKQEVVPVKKAETIPVVKKENPCVGVEIETTPIVKTSCKEMPTGIIDLQNGISGGELPYQLSWKDLTGNEEVQENLSGGYYSLTVEDANHCSEEFSIFVPTENCISSESINPDLGEEWVFTNKKGHPFTIRIIGLSGREVLRKENVQDEFFIWQGKDRDGASLPGGTYAWVVEYQDGTHNTGQITIIR